MPPVFKALASITTWVLFIFGLLSLVAGFGRIGMNTADVKLMTAYFGFGVAGLVLSVVTAKLRHSME